MKDMSVLDNLLVGRVEPHIYAFTTNTVPNYLKVGDTYRPVPVRLKEWQRHYPELRQQFSGKAKVSDSVYFRDFSVHQYLLENKGRTRLLPENLPAGVYYSNEFFQEATAADIVEAIEDISADFRNQSNHYQFYSAETQLPASVRYPSTGTWNPRPNQKDTIDAFKAAVESGRTNLLMYAVMRFGKSFTSMCCAVAMKAKYVVIVSAKADVMDEWKKTVESADNFSEYVFLRPEDVQRNYSIVTDTLNGSTNPQKVVLFLTLQDLQGEDIKKKHEQVFACPVDLLIIDETHFGARAEKYGAVLKGTTEKGSEEEKGTVEDVNEVVKSFRSRIQLHLSGTPYRILMGSEFSKEDIIAFYQFTDIVKAKEEWDIQNFASSNPKEEWDNPYYGFPQMIRFAFNPNESSRKKLEALRSKGISCSLATMFMPQSITKQANGSHKRFVYEQEVLDLLEVIDGTKEDEEVLGFLNYDKIKEGKMCRHIVCVLPYCASCDALESLIKDNIHRFKNLQDYEIINISGVDRPRDYKTPRDIKKKIADCEANDRKTLTLTVNRMLTGSTVEQWDTMLYLKDTSSPQEYDQAIFRLQNQYVKTYKSDDGHIIRYDMKPQTLLVDFDPNRIFVLQEQKAQIYNVNTDEAGNSKLEERLAEELRISPVIVMNKDRIRQVEATDILRYVSEYSRSRGVAEETMDIPVDLALLDIEMIRTAVERENELGSRDGLQIDPVEKSGEDDIEMPKNPGGTTDPTISPDGGADASKNPAGTGDEEQKADGKDPVKQFRSYYARILFYAFLTKSRVISLQEIIESMDEAENVRIARNLGLHQLVLRSLQEYGDKFMLRKLDYKIQNLSQLSHDGSISPIERATIATQKFGRLGESEIITPSNICVEMVAQIPDAGYIELLRQNRKFLDIASKVGEFSIALCRKLQTLGYGIDIIKDSLYAIPTSSISYEFTRKIYEVLGLNIENILEHITSYDLLTVKTDGSDEVDYRRIRALLTQNKAFHLIQLTDIPEGENTVKFGAIVGNPPYQNNVGSGTIQAIPIYHYFVEMAKSLHPAYTSLIIPSRWFAGGMGLDGFRKDMLTDGKISHICDYVNAKECFPQNSISGGVCYFLRDENHEGECEFTNVINGIRDTRSRKLNQYSVLIRYNRALSIVEKAARSDAFLTDIVSSVSPFGIPTKVRGSAKKTKEACIALYSSKGISYIAAAAVPKGQTLMGKYKTLLSQTSAEHANEPSSDGKYRVLTSSIKAIGPNEVCTHSYLTVGAFDTMAQAENVAAYLKTKFVRFLALQTLTSIHVSKNTFCFVPMQDFTTFWSDTKLYEKYGLTQEEIDFIESLIKPLE